MGGYRGGAVCDSQSIEMGSVTDKNVVLRLNIWGVSETRMFKFCVPGLGLSRNDVHKRPWPTQDRVSRAYMGISGDSRLIKKETVRHSPCIDVRDGSESGWQEPKDGTVTGSAETVVW